MISRFFIKLVCFWIITVFSQSSSYAAVGCDSCLQMKIIQASADIQQSFTELDSTVKENVEATNQLNRTIDESGSALVGLMEKQHESLVTAIDASVTRMAASEDQTIKLLVNLTDVMTHEMNKVIKNTTLAERYESTKNTYGPYAQPISGDIAVNRAPLLKKAMIEIETILKVEEKKFMQWALHRGIGDGTIRLRGEKVNSEIQELEPLILKMAGNLLTQSDVDNLLKLFKLIVLPNPRNVEDLRSEEVISYLNEVREAATKFSVLAREVLMRAPLLETTDWMLGYTKVEEKDGLTSINEFMLSETERKYFSPEWHLNIKTLTDAGLLREQVYQSNMTNFLLHNLVEAEKKSLQLVGG